MKTWKQRLIAALCCVVLLVTSLYVTEPQNAEASEMTVTGTMSITATAAGFVLASVNEQQGIINMSYTTTSTDYSRGKNFLDDAFIENYITFGGGMTAADLWNGFTTFYIANGSILQFKWGGRTTAFESGWSFTIAKDAPLPYLTASEATHYMTLDKEYTFKFSPGTSGQRANDISISSYNTTTFSMPTGQVHGTGKSAASATQFNITGTDITSSSIQTKYTPLQTDAQYADYIDFNGTDFSTVADKSVKIRSIFNGDTKCIQVEAWGDLRADFKVGYQVVFREGMPIYYTDSAGNAWKAVLDGTYVYEGMYSDASHDLVFSGAKIDENASIALNKKTYTSAETYVNIGFVQSSSVTDPTHSVEEDFLADYITGQYIDLSGCSVDLRANGVTFKYIPKADTIQLAFGAAAKALLKAGDTIVFKAGMPIVYNTRSNHAAACVVLDDEYTFKVLSNDGTTLKMSCEIIVSYSLSGQVSGRGGDDTSYYYGFYLGDETVWSDSNANFQGTFTNNSDLLENYFISSTATAEEMKSEGWMLRRYYIPGTFIGLRFYCPKTCWDFETGDYVIFQKGLPVSYTTTSSEAKTTYLDKDYGFVYNAETQKFTYDASLGNDVKGTYANLTISQLSADSGYDATSNAWKFYTVPNEVGNVPGTEGVTTFDALYEINGDQYQGTFTRSSDANGLQLTIPTEHLATDADDVFVTVKAGKYESSEMCAGIRIREDFTIYVYQASLAAYAGDVTCETDESAYVISEADTVEIDGVSYTKGIEYAVSGDHVLTYVVDGCTYAKRLFIYCIGDVNDDEIISVKDLVVMKKKIANMRELSKAGELSMDMNIDNAMTTDDVALLRKYLIIDAGVLALAPNANVDAAKASDAAEALITDYTVNDAQSIKTGKDIYHRDVTTLKWISFEDTEEYTILVSTNADMSGAITYTTTETNLKLINLLANTYYYWTVTANGKTSEIQHFHTADTIRTVTVEGVSNTRDGGGWSIEGSDTKVKQGMFYRGGRLEGATETGKDVMLNQLGIKTDLDLRDSAETKGESSPIDCEKYYNYSGPCYWDGTKGINLDEYKEALANAIKTFADEENYPIYVHCSLGRDRTGTICFLINALLGVSEEDLFLDYEFSVLSVTGNQDNALVADLTYQFRNMYNHVKAYAPDGTMAEATAAFLVQELKSYGVTNDTITQIRALLLEQ